MFNLKRIKKLEEELAQFKNSIVTEHTTGLLIEKWKAVAIEVRRDARIQTHSLNIHVISSLYEPSSVETRYYLKDKAPDCNYIIVDANGKEKLYKNDVLISKKK